MAVGHEHGGAEETGCRRSLRFGKLLLLLVDLRLHGMIHSVCIAGIVRLPLLSELNLSDITWSSVSVGLWINVECNIGILSACLPILRPLFSTKYPSSPIAHLNRLIRRWAGSMSGTASNSNGNVYGSSNDIEKGALSDPNSDSTAVEEAPKWPSDIWKWSRNNSDASTQNARASPVAVAARDPVPREPTARPQVLGFDEEEKRRRKVDT
ncbi:MAG: hypothetical protein Q9183_006379, partial [Haloplaca sp. 2 TL-2023]